MDRDGVGGGVTTEEVGFAMTDRIGYAAGQGSGLWWSREGAKEVIGWECEGEEDERGRALRMVRSFIERFLQAVGDT